MASPAPAKSQPLHNFSLPHHLTWKKNQNSGAGDQHHHHRSRTRLSTPPPPPPPFFRHEFVPEVDFRRQRSPASSSRRHASSDFIKSPATVNSRSDLSVIDPGFSLSNEKRKRSKICVRIKNNLDENTQKDFQEKPRTDEGNSGEVAAAEDEESVPKTWNLRPRRQMNKQSTVNGNGEVHKHGGSLYKELRSAMNNVFPEANKTEEKKEKKQEYSISVALSRREIEEDIYALTGSKPSRRPKKRSKTVQRQIETLLPGMWLGTINADMYKVSEAAPSKV